MYCERSRTLHHHNWNRTHRTPIWKIGPTARSKCSSRRRVPPNVLLNPSGPPISVATLTFIIRPEHHQADIRTSTALQEHPKQRIACYDSTKTPTHTTVSTKHTRDAKVPSAGTLLFTDITMLRKRDNGKAILVRAARTHDDASTRNRDETNTNGAACNNEGSRDNRSRIDEGQNLTATSVSRIDKSSSHE